MSNKAVSTESLELSFLYGNILQKVKKEALSEEAMAKEDLPKTSYSDYYRKITNIARSLPSLLASG